MKKKFLILILIILLPLLWYLGSPLFIDKTVNEQLPTTTEDSLETLEQSIILQGTFQGTDSFHQVQGSANIIEIGNKKYLSLTDFKSTNGPDLKVYLAKDLDAKEYVSLGDLKGNIGDQNYEISQNIDLTQYSKVLIWCERFSALFGSADLT